MNSLLNQAVAVAGCMCVAVDLRHRLTGWCSCGAGLGCRIENGSLRWVGWPQLNGYLVRPISHRHGPMSFQRDSRLRELLDRLALRLRDPFHGYADETDWGATAKRLQREFPPSNPRAPTSYELSARAQSGVGSEFASDLYDVVEIPDGRVAIVLGDFVGYGPHIMPIMVALFETIRHMVQSKAGLSEIVRLTHETMRVSDNHVALFLGMLDPARHEIDYVNAGHEPPMVVEPQGTSLHLEPTGPPIGLDVPVSVEESYVSLEPAALFIALSDGIVEASGSWDPPVFWGRESLQEFVLSSGKAPLAEISDRVFLHIDHFASSSKPQDDRTLLLLRRVAGG